MSETIVQTVSLVGHVIEDLTYAALRPSQFQAELLGVAQTPQYKPGGFFVFSDVAPGTYTLRVGGPHFQAFASDVTIPQPGRIIEAPGSNEAFVRVNSANATRLTFEMILLPQLIRAGASLLGPAGFSATLAADLEPGKVIEARIENSAGTLTPGSIVRIIRDHSIRLQWNPYTPLPVGRTRLVGTVTRQPPPMIPLHGAQVRLIQVNGVSIELFDVDGVRIGTVALNGTSMIVGTQRDMTTFTNDRGDYNLYFSVGDGLESATIEVTFDGYQPAVVTVLLNADQRQRVDVQLTVA